MPAACGMMQLPRPLAIGGGRGMILDRLPEPVKLRQGLERKGLPPSGFPGWRVGHLAVVGRAC